MRVSTFRGCASPEISDSMLPTTSCVSSFPFPAHPTFIFFHLHINTMQQHQASFINHYQGVGPPQPSGGGGGGGGLSLRERRKVMKQQQMEASTQFNPTTSQETSKPSETMHDSSDSSDDTPLAFGGNDF